MNAAPQSLSDQVAQNLAGQRAAEAALSQIHIDIAHPDTLFVRAQQTVDQHGSIGLLGFLRVVQKALERHAW